MKRHWRKSVLSTNKDLSSAFVLGCIRSLDRSLPAFRTILLATGIVGAALDVDLVADYMFATGLLVHFTIWFEGWWMARHMR